VQPAPARGAVLWLGSSDCGGSRLVPAGRSDADPAASGGGTPAQAPGTWQAV